LIHIHSSKFSFQHKNITGKPGIVCELKTRVSAKGKLKQEIDIELGIPLIIEGLVKSVN